MSYVTSGSRQFDAALGRGSIKPWMVAADYVIEDGRLVPTGDPARVTSYYPFAFPEILTEFTKLTEGDESKVLDFARKWGALRFPSTHESARPGKDSVGDPLDRIWKHASQVDRVISLIDHRRNERDESLRESLSDFLVDGTEDDIFEFEFAVATGENRRVLQTFTNEGSELHLVQPDQISSFKNALGSPSTVHLLNLDSTCIPPKFRSERGKVRILASIIIQEVINRNIDFLPMKLVMPEFDRLVRSYIYESLLAAIYSFLADAAFGERTYVRCAFCGNYLQQTDKRQRYCPPVLIGSESLCSVRSRNRHRKPKKPIKSV